MNTPPPIDPQRARDFESAVRDVDQALNAGDLAGATRLADAALDRGMQHSLFLQLRANRQEGEGQLEAALATLQQALDLDGSDAAVINAMGFCISKMGRPADAERCFDAVLEHNPDFAPALHGKGLARESLGDDAGARVLQVAAATADPRYADPRAALAALAFKAKAFDEARRAATAALALDPAQSAAALTLANLDARDGDFEAVATRCRLMLDIGRLPPLHAAAAARLLADALDALGRFPEALEAYATSNEALRRIYASQFGVEQVEDGVETCRRLQAHFRAVEGWVAAPGRRAAQPDAEGHAFLVGFPRSGTTLLEQVLAGHPAIVALEERATLGQDVDGWLTGTGLARLTALPWAEADGLRTTYWQRVRSFGVEPAGKVFVDKLPLNTLRLPLIAKLFPEARIIFAVRDPRDVVLSCFRRRFRMNRWIYAFTDLENTARFYAEAMALAEVYRAKLALAEHLHRHEDLVSDIERETRAICGFLNVPFEGAMLDFAATARGRDVRTPSATQVVKGLNAEGVGQWRRYGLGMDEVRRIVQPWVERFGYTA